MNRRDFLKGGLSVLASLFVPKSAGDKVIASGEEHTLTVEDTELIPHADDCDCATCNFAIAYIKQLQRETQEWLYPEVRENPVGIIDASQDYELECPENTIYCGDAECDGECKITEPDEPHWEYRICAWVGGTCSLFDCPFDRESHNHCAYYGKDVTEVDLKDKDWYQLVANIENDAIVYDEILYDDFLYDDFPLAQAYQDYADSVGREPLTDIEKKQAWLNYVISKAESET